MTRLILASASPRRREMLKLLGLPFDLTAASIDEAPGRDEAPAAVAARLSEDKARAARRGAADATIIASDTVVALGCEILGKPRDAREAGAMLRRLRGRRHTVHSAVTLLAAATGNTRTDVATTDVAMRWYADDEIASYVASGDALDKAGAYAIQNALFRPVAEFCGCYANVIGLPLCHLARSLHAWGIEPLPDLPTRCQAYTGHRCTVYPTIRSGQPVGSSL